MASNLVIVESPAKAKTIKKYLGSSYKVVASMGHLRDLPKSQLGVDIEHNFEPKYITIRGKGDLIAKLKKDAKSSKKIFLATDPDREGEAISWHLANLLGVDTSKPCRITFNEITKNAVSSAVKQPKEIDMNLVDAQQARRVLDRIVGYKISPLLWKKVKKGLSAGRVQSVAAKLICDREEEIEKFVPKEYWTIAAELLKGKTAFASRFYGDAKGKIEIANEEEANRILDYLKDQKFIVSDVKKSEKKKNPTPPFITSTLQQEAGRKFGYTARKTMAAAQQLYEGVDVKGMGPVGLITYMRTDSLRVSNDAISAVRTYIQQKYGDKYLPSSAKFYKTKKGAQDAHEAIRPTDVNILPDMIKGQVPTDQFKLYKLIWERFVASQMESAVYDATSVSIQAGKYIFRASGMTIKFKGFMALYSEGKDEENKQDENDNVKLPVLEKGDVLEVKNLAGKQNFTQPPFRYTEATLIKTLEENGIGRPSTYAPIITTIIQRGYVTKEAKSLKPTELGRVVNEVMKEYFKQIVDTEFTANMESELDEIEDGKIKWEAVLQKFYGPFENTLQTAEKAMEKIKIEDEVSDVICEKCGRNMVYKMGRFGKFLACPGFPECRNTKPIVKETGADCPKCGAKILEKKSAKGRKYFGCEKNPGCDFMSWDMPLKEKCPKCGGLLLQKNMRGKKKIYCYQCDYERDG